MKNEGINNYDVKNNFKDYIDKPFSTTNEYIEVLLYNTATQTAKMKLVRERIIPIMTLLNNVYVLAENGTPIKITTAIKRGGKLKPALKRTAEKQLVKGHHRIVYVGQRNRKYVNVKGDFVPLSSVK